MGRKYCAVQSCEQFPESKGVSYFRYVLTINSYTNLNNKIYISTDSFLTKDKEEWITLSMKPTTRPTGLGSEKLF